jgi:putative nucleotidyltransferase with HDIG domain
MPESRPTGVGSRMLTSLANKVPFKNDYSRFLSPNHPLLVELNHKMPGTHEHSMMVGALAVIAVEEIGGDSNQALVIGRFHDIGKLGGEELYIEARGEVLKEKKPISSREHLQTILDHPRKSVSILLNYRFPEEITKAVLEHHGTTMTRVSISPDLLVTLKEEDLRYPGPLPSSKESAIVMIADCVEASFSFLRGSRRQLAQQEIRSQICQIQTELVDMGQFNGSNLTRNELKTVCEIFEERIAHLYPNSC